MTDFLKQDVFFFVTTVAVLLVAIFLSVLLIYIIRIAKNVDHITMKIRSETDIIAAELGELRKNIRAEGVKIRHFTKFFSIFRGKKK